MKQHRSPQVGVWRSFANGLSVIWVLSDVEVFQESVLRYGVPSNGVLIEGKQDQNIRPCNGNFLGANETLFAW